MLAAVGSLLAPGCGACSADPPGGSGGGTSDSGKEANQDAPANGGTESEVSFGGTGGTSSSGWDSGLSAEHAWLADPSVWQAVPGTEFTQPLCSVYEAAFDKLAFANLVWEKCEPACEVADIVQGYGDKASLPTASTHVVGGEAGAFLVVESGVKTASVTYKVRRAVRLTDGVTVAAIEGRVAPSSPFLTCVFGNGRESASANVLMGGEPGMELTMLAPLGGGKWTWAQPAKLQSSLPTGLATFDIDASGGAVFVTGKGGVGALLDPSKNDWTILEAPSTSGVGSGQGDLAVWTDYPKAAPERIRGWAPDGKGVRTLIDPAPSETCEVTASPAWIVGIAMEGGCLSFPGAPKARFWKSPRVYDQSGANVTLGTDLPGAPIQFGGSIALKSWGDYAAAVVNHYDDGGTFTAIYLIITQLSTGKVWRLDAQPGHKLQPDAWTLTPTHLYAGDAEVADGPFTIRRMLRIDLSTLDQAATLAN